MQFQHTCLGVAPLSVLDPLTSNSSQENASLMEAIPQLRPPPPSQCVKLTAEISHHKAVEDVTRQVKVPIHKLTVSVTVFLLKLRQYVARISLCAGSCPYSQVQVAWKQALLSCSVGSL